MDAYDIIYNTLSKSDRAKIDGYFKQLIEAVIEDDNYWLANNPGGLRSISTSAGIINP